LPHGHLGAIVLRRALRGKRVFGGRLLPPSAAAGWGERNGDHALFRLRRR
jgi:hypothetical protein